MLIPKAEMDQFLWAKTFIFGLNNFAKKVVVQWLHSDFSLPSCLPYSRLSPSCQLDLSSSLPYVFPAMSFLLSTS